MTNEETAKVIHPEWTPWISRAFAKKVTKEMLGYWTYGAARLLTKEQLKMCAACAESDPRYAAVVQGIPVALCDEECYAMLRANWR